MHWKLLGFSIRPKLQHSWRNSDWRMLMAGVLHRRGPRDARCASASSITRLARVYVLLLRGAYRPVSWV